MEHRGGLFFGSLLLIACADADVMTVTSGPAQGAENAAEVWQSELLNWRVVGFEGTVGSGVCEVRREVAPIIGTVATRFVFSDFALAAQESLAIYDAVGRKVGAFSGSAGAFVTPDYRGKAFTLVFSAPCETRSHFEIVELQYRAGATKPCTREYRPVCGDDGFSYPNACTAERYEATIVHADRCQTAVGDFCGGLFSLACEGALRCVVPSSTSFAEGVCTTL